METSNVVNLLDVKNIETNAVLCELANLSKKGEICGLIYVARTANGKTFTGSTGFYNKTPVEAMVETTLLYLDFEKKATDQVIKKITEHKKRSGRVTVGEKTIEYHVFQGTLILSDGENEKIVPFNADLCHPAKLAKAVFFK